MSRPKLPEDREARAETWGSIDLSAEVLLAEALLTLSETKADGALPSGAARLSRAVAELPLRYAPFYGRLSDLWDVSEDQVQRELSRARDRRGWSLTLLRGVKTFEIEGEGRAGLRRRLMHFSAGVRFPEHRHRGAERVLVLEGSYADSSGLEVRPGEQQLMSEGSEHALTVLGEHDCIAAVAEHGLEFTGPVLRWATKLFG